MNIRNSVRSLGGLSGMMVLAMLVAGCSSPKSGDAKSSAKPHPKPTAECALRALSVTPKPTRLILFEVDGKIYSGHQESDYIQKLHYYLLCDETRLYWIYRGVNFSELVKVPAGQKFPVDAEGRPMPCNPKADVYVDKDKYRVYRRYEGYSIPDVRVSDKDNPSTVLAKYLTTKRTPLAFPAATPC